MSNRDQFNAYADAFELSYEDDNWQRLAPYFTEDAVYKHGTGPDAEGRDAVLAYFQDAVNASDRRFDTREFVGEPTVTEAGEQVHFDLAEVEARRLTREAGETTRQIVGRGKTAEAAVIALQQLWSAHVDQVRTAFLEEQVRGGKPLRNLGLPTRERSSLGRRLFVCGHAASAPCSTFRRSAVPYRAR